MSIIYRVGANATMFNATFFSYSMVIIFTVNDILVTFADFSYCVCKPLCFFLQRKGPGGSTS